MSKLHYEHCSRVKYLQTIFKRYIKISEKLDSNVSDTNTQEEVRLLKALLQDVISLESMLALEVGEIIRALDIECDA
jgi:hypothetical protein